RRIKGKAAITYHNHSPDTLEFLWVYLDQNIFREDSIKERTLEFGGIGGRGPSTSSPGEGEPAKMSFHELRRQQGFADRDYGFEILSVTTNDGAPLDHTIVGTLMRLDPDASLTPGKSTTFTIAWEHNIIEEDAIWGRSGYEHFPDDEREGGNDIFLLAQWFPRMAAYTDYEGWHNKEFLGRGEFTLEFGDYDVSLTVPDDHIVSSTGILQNPDDVLTDTQKERLLESKNADRPVFIVTPEEALKNESSQPEGTKTWQFFAENVRDFAWASSRKFMWDAQGYQQPDAEIETVMAMSFWPKEGGDLWKKYSTPAIIHTMEVYGRFSFAFPYPVIQSVNGPVGGMEYPMITFNGPRTTLRDDGDRTYTMSEKLFLIGVVIHEVGHNYFPMIVNSDERQWTWIDEGINSFLDSVAGYEWDADLPWSGSLPRDLVPYMISENQVPIMTQSDSILQFGPNAYGKPSAALHILRDTVMGRELFDHALKTFSQRWKFKRPTPSDFFRTMEEASGIDLDWFWRGWFYSTDHVDISIDRVYQLKLDTKNPDIDFNRRREEEADKPAKVGVRLNKKAELETWVDRHPDIKDFYDENDIYTVTNKDRNEYRSFLTGLEDWERNAFERALKENKNYYVLEFSNLGGLVMPILLEMEFSDGETKRLNIPAEIWRRNPEKVRKLIILDEEKELISVEVDPDWETADATVENNSYPRKIIPSRVEAYKNKRTGMTRRDLMEDSKAKLKTDADEEEEDEEHDQNERDAE
ncbi:MAG: M1 family metallopeptidase, partial [Verrucomicrobiales bacterium]|nr:M1 family metallopeptidase [Verrucomicrobiales bacterium]